MAEMDELFYRNPYLKAFEATVVSCEEGKNGFEVVLDDTAFYPEGGGQPADHGKIGEAAVSDVRRTGGRIVHYCDRAVEAGSRVKCEIDWARRYDNMQNHTGEHALSGLVHAKYGFENVGFHMDDDVITVDFDGELTPEQMAEMERKVNEAIALNKPIDIDFPDAETLEHMQYRSKKELTGRVRIVTVEDCDRCACCGTHVRSLGEVGVLKILTVSKHRGGTRVEFVCGGRAMRDYQKRIDQVQAVTALTSAKNGDIVPAVQKLLDEIAERSAQIRALEDQLLSVKADAIPNGQKVLVLFEKGMAPQQLRNYATLLAEKGKAKVVAVLSETAPGTQSYVLVGPEALMRDASKSLNKTLNGRGGGSKGIVQGSYKAAPDAIRAAIEETFKDL